MKKTGLIFLCLLYITVSLGFSLNLNYCMGQLRSVSFSNASSCCCKARAMKCCSQHHVSFQLKDAHQKAHFFYPAPVFHSGLLPLVYHRISVPYTLARRVCLSDLAPRGSDNPLYLFHQNLRV